VKSAIFTALLGLAMPLGACAPIPPPDVLRAIDKLATSPATRDAALVAPIARAHADALVREAHGALTAGDFAGAQLLGEHAKAAFEVLVAEARAVRAEERRQRSEAEAQAEGARLATLDAENQRVAADIAALELRIDALDQPVGGALQGAAGPTAEARRMRAFDTARFEARVLCTAAELLLKSPPAPEASTATASTATASTATASTAKAAARLVALDRLRDLPIDHDALREAQATVAACSHALEATRQLLAPATVPRPGASGLTAPAEDAALAAELAALGFDVLQDERGVVVRVFGHAAKAAPTEAFRSEALAAAAQKYARPVLVVHRTRDAAGAASLGSAVTGPALALLLKPLVSKRLAPNESLEIMFVMKPSFRGAR